MFGHHTEKKIPLDYQLLNDVHLGSPSLVRHFPAIAILGATQVGKTALVKMLQEDLPKLSIYLDLENSFIVRLLQPFYLNIKRRLVKSPKIYIRDSGILHYFLKIIGDGYEYFHFRTQDDAECDLLITEGFQPCATVEVKFTSTPEKTKSLTVAIENIGVRSNFIIIPECKHSYSLAENLTVCNLNSFFEMFPTNY